MSGGADVIATLRDGLLNQRPPSGGSETDGLTAREQEECKSARALRSNRELWRQQLKALFLGMSGGGEEAGRWYGPTPFHYLHLPSQST